MKPFIASLALRHGPGFKARSQWEFVEWVNLNQFDFVMAESGANKTCTNQVPLTYASIRGAGTHDGHGPHL